MKKLYFINGILVIVVGLFLYTSCKRTSHSLNATPGNVRMQSYTKVTYNEGATNNYNYSFSYDGSGRVSSIYFSTNDTMYTKVQQGELVSTFYYSNDTIIKTVKEVTPTDTVEVDTFYTNPQGLIVSATFMNYVYSYQYFGNLLINENETYRGDSGTSITADQMNFTSSNGDLLHETFDGNFTANFSTRGYNYLYSGSLTPDTVLYPSGCSGCTPSVGDMTVTWTSWATTPAVTYTHSNVTSYTDNLDNYTGGGPLQVTCMDGYGTINRDICIFPVAAWNGLWTSQYYTMYTTQANRTGDFLQLQAFTLFGRNLYNDNHLVKTIANPTDTTMVTYTIDADSKVTQTSVEYKNKNGNISSEIYDIQYTTD